MKADHKRYVVCLKYGNKYSSEYVNTLYRMVSRNLTLDYEFVCFTENSNGIDSNIRIESLPWGTEISHSKQFEGWWYKPFFFNPHLPVKGTVLFLDLDLIVFKNIDNLFTYKPGEFCIIRDFNRTVNKNYQMFNSSVFRFETGQHQVIYKDFIKNPKNISGRFLGDQDWIRHCVKSGFEFWPDEWIQSYKWEMRGRSQLENGPKGQRDFKVPGNPVIKSKTSVAVFHGDPNPHICKDQWVIDNWR